MAPNNSISFADELNPQQLAVVTSGPGPILVIAGAGSGKTRTLTYRVAYLIESGIDPHRILLLTFTNKSAREMVDRVESLIPFGANKIWGGTFHHIANRILRVHATRLGLSPDYTIMDRTDSQNLLDGCLEELGHKSKEGPVPKGSVLLKIISLARNTRNDSAGIIEQRYPFFLDIADEVEKIEALYHTKKMHMSLLDFDDLLCLWLALMEQNPAVRNYYAEQFEHILVDEYQDTNRLQSDIIDCLASRERNIMVVGDDAQSIYAFRGANFANIMDFPQRYPSTKIHKLEHNYRSSPEILDLANKSIATNQKQFHKVLQPVKEQGIRPMLQIATDVYQQAQFVTEKISELIYNGTPPGDIAVLYRAHFHSMELQMELSRRAIGFDVRSGIRFFEQAHIKDIVCYIKIILNPLDEVAWGRIFQMLPGIGTKTARKLFTHLANTKDPLSACLEEPMLKIVPKKSRPSWESLCHVIAALNLPGSDRSPSTLIQTVYENGYLEYLQSKYSDAMGRSEDIEQFIEFARQYKKATDFLSEIALMTDNETENTRDEFPERKVSLSTIHQAKGLEWPVVFILWLVEGRFPNSNNFESLEDEEEERRLFYVAATRAKDHLYLCAPSWSRDRSGRSMILKPSRFITEIPEECYRKAETTGDYY